MLTDDMDPITANKRPVLSASVATTLFLLMNTVLASYTPLLLFLHMSRNTSANRCILFTRFAARTLLLGCGRPDSRAFYCHSLQDLPLL